jgi:hypothetical protein
LTEENLAQLENVPGLFGDKISLTKTVSDAIELCRQLDENYLWVDALCILNDGGQSKHLQISAMDRICNNASITIVASSGDDANAGLSPFRTRRQISISTASISAYKFVSLPSPEIAYKSIATSKWASRGWTFQEYSLSNRVLIFNGDYIYFRCQETLWTETFGFPVSRRRDNFPGWDIPIPRPIRGTRTNKDILSKKVSFGRFDEEFSILSDRLYPEAYGRGVAIYLARNLTKEGDILNAFLGFLNRLESELGRHKWGLPSKEFGIGMQWFRTSDWPMSRRAGFPSWSWAGWLWCDRVDRVEEDSGGIYQTRQGKPSRGESYVVDWGSISALTCFHIAEDGSVQCLDRHSLERAGFMQLEKTDPNYTPPLHDIKDHCDPPHQPAKVLHPYLSSRHLLSSRRSHIVLFSASCAVLSLSPYPAIETSEFDYFEVRNPKNGYPLGAIILNSEWRKCQQGNFEFVVVSIGEQAGLGVILISRLATVIPKVYERVPHSILHIHAFDWVSAHPRKRNIVLV